MNCAAHVLGVSRIKTLIEHKGRAILARWPVGVRRGALLLDLLLGGGLLDHKGLIFGLELHPCHQGHVAEGDIHALGRA